MVQFTFFRRSFSRSAIEEVGTGFVESGGTCAFAIGLAGSIVFLTWPDGSCPITVSWILPPARLIVWVVLFGIDASGMPVGLNPRVDSISGLDMTNLLVTCGPKFPSSCQ